MGVPGLSSKDGKIIPAHFPALHTRNAKKKLLFQRMFIFEHFGVFGFFFYMRRLSKNSLFDLFSNKNQGFLNDFGNGLIEIDPGCVVVNAMFGYLRFVRYWKPIVAGLLFAWKWPGKPLVLWTVKGGMLFSSPMLRPGPGKCGRLTDQRIVIGRTLEQRRDVCFGFLRALEEAMRGLHWESPYPTDQILKNW